MYTTPPPITDPADVFPFLRERARAAIRLHPRPGDVPDPRASKIGGDIAWPVDEPWPMCPEHGSPLISVLQFRRDDVPSGGDLPFPADADTLQILWCPREHDEPGLVLPRIIWRNVPNDVEFVENQPRIPQLEWESDEFNSEGYFVPRECMVWPEAVREYPAMGDLEWSGNPLAMTEHRQIKQWNTDSLRPAVEAKSRWNPEPFEPGEWLYRSQLSVCPGTKLGGHVDWIQYPDWPECDCGNRMDHLVTFATREPYCGEWIGDLNPRWWPLEEQDVSFDEAERRGSAIGWELGDSGCVYGFVCRRCRDWPTSFVFQCG